MSEWPAMALPYCLPYGLAPLLAPGGSQSTPVCTPGGVTLGITCSGLFFFKFLAVLGLCCCAGFSLVIASEGYSHAWTSCCSGFSCCGAQALGLQ